MATIKRGIKVSAGFYEAVASYGAEHGVNWNRALVELAILGLQSVGKLAPVGLPPHGGNRRTTPTP